MNITFYGEHGQQNPKFRSTDDDGVTWVGLFSQRELLACRRALAMMRPDYCARKFDEDHKWDYEWGSTTYDAQFDPPRQS